MARTAILDVDGTLVDTNYQHAIAWYRAFRRHGIVLPLWRVHRHIGMGGDQLVAALCDDATERERGDDIRAAEKELYSELIGEVEPLDGARELIAELKERGHPVVLASSAKEEEVEHYIDLLGARELADGWTTSEDVEATKPEPDLVNAAIEKGSGDGAVLVGDSTWDCQAAGRAGIACVGVLTGGFSDRELHDAGATVVFESIAELRRRLGETPSRSDASAGGGGFGLPRWGIERGVTPLTIAIAALLLGLLIGSIAVWGAPIFAIPIVLVALAIIGLGQMRRRSERARDIGELRHEAAAEKVEFTERDRETLA